VQELTLVALHLLNNIARPYTLNKLAKSYGIKSTNTVSNFVKFYEDSYLLFSVPKFDFSFKKQQVNEKKIYAIDAKFAQQNSTQLQEDTGRILENLVFLEIRRKTTQIWYYKKTHECDFIYHLDGKYHAVQVCHQLNADNIVRETAGMQEAMADLELASTTFITTNQTEDLHIANKKVVCIPFFDWAK
jgi:predicted AAA+ superfamily ATPase